MNDGTYQNIWYNKMWSHIALMLIGLFLLGFIIYLLLILKQLNFAFLQMRNQTPSKMYDNKVVESLLIDAIRVLKSNINMVTQPFFYTKSVEDILRVLPEYKHVLMYVQYMDQQNVPTDVFEKVMSKNYGERYTTSPELVQNVTVKTAYSERTYQHSLLVDLSKAQVLYAKNKKKVDMLLLLTTQEEKVL